MSDSAIQNLVGSQYKKYRTALSNIGIDQPDAMQIGWVAAMEAQGTFDPAKGTRLSTWICANVRRRFAKEIDRQCRRDRIARILFCADPDRVEHRPGPASGPPTINELGRAPDPRWSRAMDRDDHAEHSPRPHTRSYRPFRCPLPARLGHQEDVAAFWAALELIRPEPALALCMRFGLTRHPDDFDSIGRYFGGSRWTAGRMIKKALRELRVLMRGKNLGQSQKSVHISMTRGHYVYRRPAMQRVETQVAVDAFSRLFRRPGASLLDVYLDIQERVIPQIIDGWRDTDRQKLEAALDIAAIKHADA